ncbi:MAG: DUF2892 domain-containing protein [Planctomycetaceae bacterium]|nr:DUF2892 domain-containing protein [Planctomycetaceae bacterium]
MMLPSPHCMRRVGFALVVCAVLALLPSSLLAHQPRIASSSGMTDIRRPEVSQAFYGELIGSPAEFRIQSEHEFRLYVGLLVPDIAGVRKDISAEIVQKTSDGARSLATLDGTAFHWKPFFERFGGDNYFWGPEFEADGSGPDMSIKGRTVPGGTYLIRVFSPTNQGKYVLATGDVEVFPVGEMLHAARIMPRLKAEFFDKSPLEIILSPIGWGYILAIYVLVFIAGFVYRLLLRRLARNTLQGRAKNIGGKGRLLRAGVGLVLLVWAVTTSWNPLLLALSGFCFFEAIFSWCGLYAAIGKSSCPAS